VSWKGWEGSVSDLAKLVLRSFAGWTEEYHEISRTWQPIIGRLCDLWVQRIQGGLLTIRIEYMRHILAKVTPFGRTQLATTMQQKTLIIPVWYFLRRIYILPRFGCCFLFSKLSLRTVHLVHRQFSGYVVCDLRKNYY
jgi:hypothetical protein